MATKQLTRKVTLTGIVDIMFDRYAGDNKTELRPDQKMYLNEKGEFILPAANVDMPERLVQIEVQRRQELPDALGRGFLALYPKELELLEDRVSLNVWPRYGRTYTEVNPLDEAELYKVASGARSS